MVERGGLENRCALLGTQGSNPCLSAMFYTYILLSEKDNRCYYGSTSDLDQRVKAHNQGKVRSTRSRRPLKLIYYESYETKKVALQRELFFKTKAGYIWLKNQGII